MSFIRLIAIAKDEAPYLAEWVHHHLHFGFNQIAVILNSCSDNSRQLLECIAEKDSRLIVRDGDTLKSVCERSGQNFQSAAYAQELAFACQDERVSHVMCLDIDEFWVTPDLTETIHTYTERYPQADSIAFSWHMEVPSDPVPFISALQKSYQVTKDNHVKSLHRVSIRLISLQAHNATHVDGNYILANGKVFPQHTFSGHDRATVPNDLFLPELNCVDCAFIYHRVFRSQQEYLASLQRGRPDGKPYKLKSNRWGYKSAHSKKSIISVQHPSDALSALYLSFALFVEKHQITTEIEQGQKQAMVRCNASLSLFANENKETNELAKLFTGITINAEASLASMLKPVIAHHIDTITASDEGWVIKGWVVDVNSSRSVYISLPLDWQIQSNITRKSRADVVQHYPGANLNNGFHIELRSIISVQLDIEFICNYVHKKISLQLR